MPPAAKAHPYLRGFGKLGLVEQDALTGRYGLGPFALPDGPDRAAWPDPIRVAGFAAEAARLADDIRKLNSGDRGVGQPRPHRQCTSRNAAARSTSTCGPGTVIAAPPLLSATGRVCSPSCRSASSPVPCRRVGGGGRPAAGDVHRRRPGGASTRSRTHRLGACARQSQSQASMRSPRRSSTAAAGSRSRCTAIGTGRQRRSDWRAPPPAWPGARRCDGRSSASLAKPAGLSHVKAAVQPARAEKNPALPNAPERALVQRTVSPAFFDQVPRLVVHDPFARRVPRRRPRAALGTATADAVRPAGHFLARRWPSACTALALPRPPRLFPGAAAPVRHGAGELPAPARRGRATGVVAAVVGLLTGSARRRLQGHRRTLRRAPAASASTSRFRTGHLQRG